VVGYLHSTPGEGLASQEQFGKKKKNKHLRNGAWWYTAVIPALGRLKQKDQEIEASLSYMVRPCLKNKNKNKKGLDV
jgi:hypothetical protein